jgi:peptide chain release factor 1
LNKFRKFAIKEIAKLESRSQMYKQFDRFFETIQDWDQIIREEKDKELIKMAKEELDDALEELDKAQDKAVESLVPVSELDDKDWTMEIKSAAGGTESALFAEELKNMYESYCKMQGWRWIQHFHHQDNLLGRGWKHAKFEIKGINVYGVLKHEAGVHKVQRVPETEKQGRLHSSTAVIVVMPVIPSTFSINQNDIRIDTMRASGAGGQHVNTTDSAVRATHIPTGIIVVNKDQRDQHQNKDKALEILRERVYKYYAEIEINKIMEQKKAQIGTGNLSEKIRTYNWPNNRITDHRTQSQKFGLDSMLSGVLLQEFIDELIDKEKNDWISLILDQQKK